MSVKRRPSATQDHINRDAYIYLSLLSAHLSSGIEELCAEYKLTESHYRVLWVLCLNEDSEPMAMGDIVDGVINKAADITRLVDKLQRLGLITRTTSSVDKRRVLVRSTSKGKRVFTELTRDIKALHYEQWEGLDNAELETLVHLLKKLVKNSET